MKKISMMSLLLLLFSAVFVSCSEPTINDLVNEIKSQTPKDLGEGFVMTDANIVDNVLQTDMTTDESSFMLNDPTAAMMLPMLADHFKEIFLGDEDMREVYEMCAKEGLGFRMVMKGTKSGESIPILDVSPEELKAKFPPKE